jgi:iron complex transport system ATP-binding protein
VNLTITDLTWSASGKEIVKGVTAQVRSGELAGLIGPNGSGKSSLLRCVAGLRAPSGGSIRYGGADISDWPAGRLARSAALVEQSAETDSDLRVRDVVGLGRTPYTGRWRGLGRADREVVADALARVGLTALADRSWRTLSGGERQRAHLARALAQQTDCVLLDEPTNHLDLRHQYALMDLLASAEQTVVIALHDLSLAARYCDRLLLMHGGRLVADGAPRDVLTPDRLRTVFGVDAEVGRDGLGNTTVACRGVAAEYPG